MTIPDQHMLASRCARIDYHLSHHIQPQFAMVVLDPELSVVRASENVEALMGELPDALIGRYFPDLADGAIKNAIADLQARLRGRVVNEIIPKRTQRRTDAVWYRSGDYFCGELELTAHHDLALPLLSLQLAAAIAESEREPEDLATLVCSLLHRIAGFDRTYYCEFDDDGNGFVSGEHVTGALPPLLHHHFPASDIPASVRPIYVRNRIRCIADTEATPVAVPPATTRGTSNLDLTFSLARQPAATHVHYLQNMGVRGSSSFSVVRNGRLSALFGGHSLGPRVLRYRQLSACQQLVEAYVHRHGALENARVQRSRESKLALVQSMITRLSELDCDTGRLVDSSREQLCNLMDSDGLLARVGGTIHGATSLREDDVHRLFAYVSEQLRPGQVWSTNSLEKAAPELGSIARYVSGVVAVAFDREAEDIVMWTRVSQDREVRWAGNPAAAVVLDERGGVGPRKSFATWIEAVSGIARAWSSDADSIAMVFRDRANQTLAAHYQSKATAAAQQANEYKTQFIANISHELRTPMHSILGFVGLLRDKLDTMPPERQKVLLGSVMSSGERLLELIDDLLDLSKLEAGQMTFHFEHASILPAIERAMVEASAKLDAKQIAVVVDSLGIDPHLTFDIQRTVQVLINLLANAANASPHGASITVLLRDSGEPLDPCLLIEIADRGVGIPELELERIFDKFTQSERTRNGAGSTGLGLSICRQIVAHHRGRIWAVNRAEGGASLFIEYPRHQKER